MTRIDKALDQIRQALQQRQAHPARTLVLLPFAQLLPEFSAAWAQRWPSGFAPRFATSQSWARQMGATGLEGDDFRHDPGLDSLTARSLLDRANVSEAALLVPRLVEACSQLAPLAAAQAPGQRLAWAASCRAELVATWDTPGLALEHAVGQLALAWAGSSNYLTDVVWHQGPLALDCLLLLPGLQPDPLTQAWLQAWPDVAQRIDWLPDAVPDTGAVQLHPCQDLEDEAQCTAAWALAQLQTEAPSPDRPLALVAIDRSVTRRVRALLDARGVPVRDETGWKLSTTRAAANLMRCLDAAQPQASTDAVLDWLKNSPAAAVPEVLALEQSLRRQRCRSWLRWRIAPSPLQSWVDAHREALQAPRPWRAWLAALAGQLQVAGQWQALQADPAGQAVLSALHLDEADQPVWADWPPAGRRLRLAEFARWCQDALEAASFVPPSAPDAVVVLLPMGQLLARSFGAVLLPGCDEVHLNLSPDLPGVWTPSQRAALGLPSAAQSQATLRAAWQQGLAAAASVHVLWREQGAEGEPLQPASLVQALQLARAQRRTGSHPALPDPRVPRLISPQPGLPPTPRGTGLNLAHLSASAYADLRQCPYRFFAQRLLGLKDPPELDQDTDKRDFGEWLHEVLKRFHEAQAQHRSPDADLGPALDRIATECREQRQWGAREFLPFMASWPGLRDGYLRWWLAHSAQGLHFAHAETDHRQGLGSVTLIGRIDRIDHGAREAEVMVIDYKTESLATTKERVKHPLEDTQLAFYAALLPHDSLRAAYVNVGESDGTILCEQPAIDAARHALANGILDDVQAIRQGAVLAALGEGSACDYCAARGLCRKDFWTAV
ncbi:MAG: hypothetical protein RLZZ401_2391 [Pseudomonadota bacterium]|jgi:ATP-dependent helicase/nuclease subunit B